MHFNCVETFIILLLAVSVTTAQRSWGSVFGYHRNDNYEIPHPRIVRIFDDDFLRSLRRLHLFDPFDTPPPVIYLPGIHHAPEVYVDDFHPYGHRFREPLHFNRMSTTLTLTYRIVPVIDKDETVTDTSDSASNTVSPVVTNSVNDPKASNTNTTKKDEKTEATGSTDQESVKTLTSKPNADTATKSDAGEKPNGNKTTESKTKPQATEVSANTVDVVESKPVKEEAKTEDKANVTSHSTTPKDSSDGANPKSAQTAKSDASTTDKDVPAV